MLYFKLFNRIVNYATQTYNIYNSLKVRMSMKFLSDKNYASFYFCIFREKSLEFLKIHCAFVYL